MNFALENFLILRYKIANENPTTPQYQHPLKLGFRKYSEIDNSIGLHIILRQLAIHIVKTKDLKENYVIFQSRDFITNDILSE